MLEVHVSELLLVTRPTENGSSAIGTARVRQVISLTPNFKSILMDFWETQSTRTVLATKHPL